VSRKEHYFLKNNIHVISEKYFAYNFETMLQQATHVAIQVDRKKISNSRWNCKQFDCCNYKVPYVARTVDYKSKELDEMFVCLGLRGTLFIEFKNYLNKNIRCYTLVVK
jgi:hypothetical protein